MANVGTAAVTIIPSFKGFQKSVEKGVLGSTASVGSTGGALLGSKLKSGFKKAVKGGTAGLIAAGGFTAYKGWDRLLNIEDAQAKLKGLGYGVEEIQAITDNALAAVKGTPYALDEAFTVASSLLASGVEAGGDLERVLGLVADSATQSGTSMGAMGQIWGKVFAKGKIQGQEMAQLAANGVPIYDLLAESMGVTAEEVMALGAAGEISAEDFTQAMTAFEGSAKQMGDTTRGAFANFKTSVASLGADALEPLQPVVKDLLDRAYDWVNDIKPKVVAGIEELIEVARDFGDWVAENKEPIKDVAAVIGGVVGALVGLAQIKSGIAALKGLGGLLKLNPAMLAVSAIAAGIALIWRNWDTVGPKLKEIYDQYIEPVFSVVKEWVVGTLIPAFEQFADYAVNVLWPALKDAWAWISDAIVVAWQNFIQPALSALWGFIQNVLIPVFNFLWEHVVKPVWNFISWHIDAAWNTIRLVFDLLIAGVGFVGDKFTWLKDNIIGPVWDWVSDKIGLAWDKIRPIFETIRDWLSKYLGPAFTTFKDVAIGAFETLANLLLDPVQFIVNTVYNDGIKKVFDAVAEAVGSSARLPSAHISDVRFTRSTSSNKGKDAALRGRGGSASMRAFAKGGYATPGWALVGEEGPELVNFVRPGRVYTAGETRGMLGLADGYDFGSDELVSTVDALNRGQLSGLTGSSPAQSRVAAGGESVADKIGKKWSEAWRGAWGVTKTIGGGVFDFARGALADTAELVLTPLRSGLANTVGRAGTIGSIASSTVNKSIDMLLDWVRGKDDEDREMVANLHGPDVSPMMLGALAGMSASGSGSRPVHGGTLTSLFGPRWGGHHAGVDFAVPVGTPVWSWRDGVVTRAQWNALAGRTGIGIALAHADGLGSYYGHLSKALVSPGQVVKAGQMIGLSGNTGRSTGPHVHFEISRGNNPHNVVNPLPFLHDDGGLLMPGMHVLANRTRKPEPVLSSSQWADISRLALSADSRGDVYVENPWTGEYMRAEMVRVADRRVESSRRWS